MISIVDWMNDKEERERARGQKYLQAVQRRIRANAVRTVSRSSPEFGAQSGIETSLIRGPETDLISS